jgi:cell division protein FtsQ
VSDVAGGPRSSSPATIDPRIRARRIAVQRDVGHRRLRRLLTALGLVAVVAGAWGLTRTPLLDVDRLEVRGAANTGTEAVVAASTLHRGAAMVTAPLGRAADGVAALPWVQTVEVHRRWPGTVIIEVTERRPVAYVPAPEGVILVDAERRQLAYLAQPPADYVRLDVPAVRPQVGELASATIRPVLDIAATVPKVLAPRIVSLRPETDGSVSGVVRLRDGAEAAVLLGAPTQLGAKWLALAAILDEADPARLAQIDLRVPGAPALTRR